MSDLKQYEINVDVLSRFLDEQSDPAQDRYVFSYTIRIENVGTIGAKLLSRHWLITDANGTIQEVRGEGVVGEQPWLQPGEAFEYTSGAVIATDIGSMQGSYQMRADDGTLFETPIDAFSLSIPRTLH